MTWLLVAFLGCATTGPEPEVASTEAPEAAPSPVEPPGFSPRTVTIPDEAPRPPAFRLLEERRFSLNVQDAPLRGVLLGLGRDSAFNTVVEPGVVGSVTADFEDVSLREILDQLLRPRGYRYVLEGNILRVYRTERGTRIYKVDYPNYSRSGSSDLTISGAIAAQPQVGEGGGSTSAAEDTSTSGVQTTQVLDFWKEVEEGLRGIVFGSIDGEEDADEEDAVPDAVDVPDRSVVVARQAGLITVTAEPEVLRDVEHYLREVSLSTERQVLIDVQILEIDLGDDLSLGVDWDVAVGLGRNVDGSIGRGAGLDPAFLAQDLAPALLNGGFMFGIVHEEFSAAVNAIADQRDVRVVSTPRLATLNNHKALIKVVRNEIFFIAEVNAEVVDQVGVAQVTEFTPQIVPVGVTLDITPQISDDDRITMHLHPSISEIVDIVTQPSGSPLLDATGSLPVIDLRETDTVMRVDDGSTILIGGLIQSREIERQAKVPVFGDIPWLGQAFRQSNVEHERTELVILVTPRILDAPMISRLRDNARDSFAVLEALRERRLAEGPWWRRPIGESYGVEFDDVLP
ncbi:MAG: secretin N-terminal domain-containing protein [Myxococcota bacterium]